jgi:hypothetical protein
VLLPTPDGDASGVNSPRAFAIISTELDTRRQAHSMAVEVFEAGAVWAERLLNCSFYPPHTTRALDGVSAFRLAHCSVGKFMAGERVLALIRVSLMAQSARVRRENSSESRKNVPEGGGNDFGRHVSGENCR